MIAGAQGRRRQPALEPDSQTDHFNLVGAGSADNVQIGFNVVVLFSAPGEEPTIEEISVHGNPACDVI